ncbi:hypothetical protein ACHAP3_008080 [Botrytis cinerea]
MSCGSSYEAVNQQGQGTAREAGKGAGKEEGTGTGKGTRNGTEKKEGTGTGKGTENVGGNDARIEWFTKPFIQLKR